MSSQIYYGRCEKCDEKYEESYNAYFGWCKLCQKNFFKENFVNWTSKNEKIDDFVRKMQLKINDPDDIIFEWIPCDQFSNVNEINKCSSSAIYSAIWNDGPLYYHLGAKKYTRDSNKIVALKYLFNSRNIINELLNKIKEYSIEMRDNVLKIHGISQDPVTGDYIIILEYAKGGNFNNWINKYYKNITWLTKLGTLLNISNGLKEIHQKQIVHGGIHAGNILFLTEDVNIFSDNALSISDMGLCGDIGNTDKTKIYGVMPYIAPEVLRGNPYTQKADIYGFGMIMYFASTGEQPFADNAHDQHLALEICKGARPKINNSVPECYVDLMKKCWDQNPDNRPSAIEIYELVLSFRKSYAGAMRTYENEIERQFDEAEKYRKANPSPNQSPGHSQAIYMSQLLNPFIENLRNDDFVNST